MKSLIISAAAVLALAGCAGNSGTTYSAAQPVAAVQPVSAKPATARTTARGSFVGDKGHVTTGTGEVFRDNGQWFVRLGPDFSLDGGPDPKVALGNKASGGYQPGTILGKLSSLNGEQVYALKPGLDIADYDQIYIWCEQFSVPLGHANLALL